MATTTTALLDFQPVGVVGLDGNGPLSLVRDNSLSNPVHVPSRSPPIQPQGDYTALKSPRKSKRSPLRAESQRNADEQRTQTSGPRYARLTELTASYRSRRATAPAAKATPSHFSDFHARLKYELTVATTF